MTSPTNGNRRQSSRSGPMLSAPDLRARRTVEAMAAFGIEEDQIARAHRMSRTALRRQFRQELATGAARANAKVVASLFDAAIGGNVAAQIFWAKSRLGWRDKIGRAHV